MYCNDYLKRAIWGCFLTLMLLAGHACTSQYPRTEPPSALKGVMDFSNWDFDRNGPVPLHGQWTLYWEQLLPGTPQEDIRPDGYLSQPGSWNSHILPDGGVLSSFGYATLSLHITGLNSKDRYMLYIPASFCSHRILFRNTSTNDIQLLAEAGEVGISRESYHPYLASGQAVLPRTNEGTLYLQISNFHRADPAGTWTSIQFGTEQQILASIFKNRQKDFLVIGASLIIGIYSLIIFSLRREEKESLWFGLFCLSLMLWFISTGDYLSEYTNVGYHTNDRFNFLVPYALLLTFFLYLRALFPLIFRELFSRIIVLLTLIQCLIVLLTPPEVFTKLVSFYEYYLAILGILIVYGLVRAVIFQRDLIPILNLSGAIVLLISGLIYSLNLHYSYIGTSHFVLQSGVIVFTLFNASVIAVLNSRARRRSEDLSLRLTEERNALQMSEEKYRLITETSLDCIFTLDHAGRFTDVSPSMRRILGRDRDFYINSAIVSIVRPEDHDKVSRMLETALTGGSMRNLEVHAVSENGYPVPMEISATPIVKEERIHAIQCAGRDISDRKKAEEERRLLEQQVYQAQKMEAIGLLAGGIAHDFNNILAAMIGFTEMTMGKLTDPGLKDNVESILAGCFRARDLVRQILTFSRTNNTEKHPLKMDIIVREALRLMRAALPSTIEILQHIDPASRLIMADATQIHQVIMNLCTNAGYAMGEKGGILNIEIKDTAIPEDNSMNLKPGIFVSLTISDTGQGIGPEHLEKIFDPFFTTKETGLGMGLAVVYGIVKDHGGAITVESQPGQGAAFTVYLPGLQGGEETYPLPEAQEIPGGSESILLVDDEQEILRMQKRLLESLGYTVTAYSDASGALELFKEDPARFDLIITDMIMPGMTGKELAVLAMQLREDLPIILCTGYTELITEEQALSLGITEFLVKPYTTGDIARALRRALDSRASRELRSP